MGVCEGEYMGRSSGDEPLVLTRCHIYMKLVKGGSPFCGRAYNFKAIKRQFSVFLFLQLSFLSLFLALLRADHAVAGLGVCLININI